MDNFLLKVIPSSNLQISFFALKIHRFHPNKNILKFLEQILTLTISPSWNLKIIVVDA